MRLHVDALTGKIGINNSLPNSSLDITAFGSTSATSSLNVKNSFSTSLFYVRDDGRVGINTTNPSSIFSVSGDLDVTGMRLHVDALTGKIGINNSLPNSSLDITAFGSTSATSSLNVKNSFSTSMLFVRDDGFVGVGSTNPTSTLQVGGSVGVSVASKTASYTLTASDYCLIYTGAAASTFTLPAASGCPGRIYIILNHGTVTLATSAFTTGNASTAATVGTGTSVQLISDGTVWRKIN